MGFGFWVLNQTFMSTAAAKALAGILVFVSYSVRLTYAIVHLKSLSASFIDAPARFGMELLGFFFFSCLFGSRENRD